MCSLLGSMKLLFVLFPDRVLFAGLELTVARIRPRESVLIQARGNCFSFEVPSKFSFAWLERAYARTRPERECSLMGSR